MAKVYRRVNGVKLTKIIATHQDVERKLDLTAVRIATRAAERLAEHRHDGDARIEVDHGDVDRYVVLSDERGLGAAMSIEYGRRADEDERWGPMDGLFILHEAAGLPHGGD